MKIYLNSLGCDKNLVDAEVMTGLLVRAGHQMTSDETEAEVIIVNSCCFIGDAKEESINTILELAGYKETGCCRYLIVTGCLAERYRDEVIREMPEVDAVVGINGYGEIVKVIDSLVSGEKSVELLPDNSDGLQPLDPRSVSTGGHYAYLKIAEGCNKYCTYCVIPYVRGRYRSYPMEELLEQARRLVSNGVGELILVAQEITLYGTDLYGRKALPGLLRRLAEIPDLHWIRLMYCYPEEITDEMIGVIASEDKICKYLDIPIQHASDRVLKRMGRKTDNAEIRELIAKLRERVPGICLRTTLMTGFPGETEEDHEDMMELVGDMRFDRLGVFTYSREEGTAAAEMENQVPEDIAAQRRDEIMELQQEIAFEIAEEQIGRTLDVIIEGRLPEDDVYVGRTYRDAPDVDGYIFIDADRELMSGDFVQVTVTDAADYDLIGELTDEDESA